MFSLGHAYELRHDRQFLGRAGRQGDPFTARFICSLDDPILRAVGIDRLKGLMRMMEGADPDPDVEAMSYPLWIIRQAQKRWRAMGFISRRAQDVLDAAQMDIHVAAVGWFQMLQLPGRDGMGGLLSPEFLDWVVEQFVQQTLRPRFGALRELKAADAEALQALVADTLGVTPESSPVQALHVEGRDAATVLETVRRRLGEFVADTQQACVESHQKIDNVTDVQTACRDLDALLAWCAENTVEVLDAAVEGAGAPAAALARGADADGTTETGEGRTPAPVEAPGGDAGFESEWDFATEAGEYPASPATEARAGAAVPAADGSGGAVGMSVAGVEPTEVVEVHDEMEEAQARALLSDLRVRVAAMHAALRGDRIAPVPLAREAREVAKRLDVLRRLGASGAELHDDFVALRAQFEPSARWAVRELPASMAERRLRKERVPRLIALWRIQTAWLTFLEERDRIHYEAGRRGYASLDYFRVVTDRVTHLWEQRELALPGELLHDLVRAPAPELLDDLFFIPDHQASLEIPAPDRAQYAWGGPRLEGPNPEARSRPARLVDQFLARAAGDPAGDPAGERAKQMRNTLVLFLERTQLSTLQSPERIQTALEQFLQEKASLGVRRDRLRNDKRWLREFLLDLRRQNLVGPLPTLRTRVRSAAARFTGTVTERKTILPLAGTLVFLGVWLVLTAYGPAAAPRVLDGVAAHLDRLLFGGMLAAGVVTAATFAVPALAHVFATVGGFSKPYALLLPGKVALVLQAAIAAWITPWSFAGVSAAASSLAVFATAFTVAEVGKRAIWSLDQSTGVDLTYGWLAATALILFVPGVVEPATAARAFACVAAAVGGVALWRRVNRLELTLVSGRITGAGTAALEMEPITTAATVTGAGGVGPHVFGVLCAWLVHDLAGRMALPPGAAAAVAPAVYLLVVVYWVRSEIRLRLDPKGWMRRLSSRRQRLLDADGDAAVEAVLRKARMRLTWRELLFQAVLLLAMFAALRGATVPGTTFPAAPALLFASVLAARLGEDFATSVWRFFFSRVPYVVEQLDLSRVRDPEEKLTPLQKIRDVLSSRAVTVLTVIAVLLKVLPIVLDALKLISLP